MVTLWWTSFAGPLCLRSHQNGSNSEVSHTRTPKGTVLRESNLTMIKVSPKVVTPFSFTLTPNPNQEPRALLRGSHCRARPRGGYCVATLDSKAQALSALRLEGPFWSQARERETKRVILPKEDNLPPFGMNASPFGLS